MTAPAFSTLVCYHGGDDASRRIAERYVQARGRRARLLALPLTCSPDASSIRLTTFREEIQKPIYATDRTRFVVLCRGVPWKLWSDDWREQQSVDSNLVLPPEEGGGSLRPLGSPFLLDPKRVREHPTFRFVSRIDGASADDCLGLIGRTLQAEADGWQDRHAVYTSPFPPEKAVLEERGWTVTSAKLPAWDGEQRTELWRGYCGSPAGAHFGSCPFAPSWFGWSTQSTGMLNMRSLSYWCPYVVACGGIATLGATAEPGLGGFPGGYNVLLPFLQWGWAWAEAVWFATVLVNFRVAPIGDPTWRMRRSTRTA